MPKPIEFTPRLPTPQEQLHTEIEDSAQALEESLRLLRELHEHGVLELLIKLVRGGEGLAVGALHTLGSDQVLLAMRTVIELSKALGSLHPADIRQLAQGLGTAASAGARSAARGTKVTPLEIPKLLVDPDVQLALGAVFGLLKGLGQGLREAREDTDHAPSTLP
ncbi:hypothetical protein Dxin01_00074 [Deinococcus xinjiangensis]|uniref:DUF1641 domain-containing protein n=1 Tax=Deinococcus xinjiangensis TaxID=457454 RepID=A0ABP9V573_9DEIO